MAKLKNKKQITNGTNYKVDDVDKYYEKLLNKNEIDNDTYEFNLRLACNYIGSILVDGYNEYKNSEENSIIINTIMSCLENYDKSYNTALGAYILKSCKMAIKGINSNPEIRGFINFQQSSKDKKLIDKVIDDYYLLNGEEPSIKYILEKTNLTYDSYIKAMNSSCEEIDRPINGSEENECKITLGDLLEGSYAIHFDEKKFKRAFGFLTDKKEIQVMSYYFGGLGFRVDINKIAQMTDLSTKEVEAIISDCIKRAKRNYNNI